MKNKKTEPYQGFEQGPIRPPSEAASLLIRITRNCPWNRCTFCPVYKGSRFSLRPAEHVKADIDMVHKYVSMLRQGADASGRLDRQGLSDLSDRVDRDEYAAFNAALHWTSGGMESVFLQDANSLILPPDDLIDIVKHLHSRFPWIQRVTSYARSHTVRRIPEDKLAEIRQAGLNRIHIGLESGSDKVLELVKKGVTKADHVEAGQKVKAAGFELSEYVMPGLGGVALSTEHAAESADALNRINPDFIRLRTLAVPPGLPLHEEYRTGRFKKLTDVMVAKELLLFLESLEGVTSMVKSDHILNLFAEVEGRLPEEKQAMTRPIRAFLDMAPEDRVVYQIGRRLSVFNTLEEMKDDRRAARVRNLCAENNITPDNVESVIEEAMNRFI
ncbi:radical SAM protein [Desulfosudis oleivorans]|uniref:Radical SAM domain protein n=1 Tax=Desulfosudis oleivorans (strain DSM 6200 / JCM 39069 / Hxd3) TaxID=96561 RepID=A8ZZ53_DESOH|nr:radical SAM protein [Desulfosudis oleivorans]ABW68826.1 Radical SAM domain protein [Desulfosudis oleivorans Hxd3]